MILENVKIDYSGDINLRKLNVIKLIRKGYFLPDEKFINFFIRNFSVNTSLFKEGIEFNRYEFKEIRFNFNFFNSYKFDLAFFNEKEIGEYKLSVHDMYSYMFLAFKINHSIDNFKKNYDI